MSKKRTYIILIIAVLSFFIVMFLLFGLDNIKRGKYATILVVGDNTIWTYSNNNWSNVVEYTKIKNLNWKNYKVYLNNEYFGKYQLWHDDKWYAFDKDKKAVILDGELLAYNSNYNIDVKGVNESPISDRTYVNYVLQDNDLSPSSETTSEFLVSFDYDNDGVEEDFYVISNVFPIGFEPEMSFSIVFMVKNDKIYYIYNDVSKNRDTNGCKPYFTSFLDADNDGMYEFVLSCGRYSISEPIDMLYKFDHDEFKILISNQ